MCVCIYVCMTTYICMCHFCVSMYFNAYSSMYVYMCVFYVIHHVAVINIYIIYVSKKLLWFSTITLQLRGVVIALN